MDTVKEKRRWPIALIIIAAIVIASVVIALSYHDSPGRISVAAIGDASGNTLITWQSTEGIFAQRLDLSGQSLWGEDGVLVAGFPPKKSYTWISDGAGGAIFIWFENVDFDHDDPGYFNPVTFYAQRINTRGELMWGNGVLIGDSNSHGVDYPAVATDGSGGAIFAWNDYRPFYKALHEDILCLKKLDAVGRSLWDNENIVVTASTSYHTLTEEEIAAGIKGTYTQSRPTYTGQFAAVHDGTGGVIVFWEDEITNRSDRVYAQRFDERGDATWPDKIVIVDEGLRSVESDGAGGAFIKTPAGTVYSGIGQVGRPLIMHIGGDGEILATREYSPDIIIRDGIGGFIRLRIEEEPPTGPPWERRAVLYVQRQDGAGKTLWPEKLIINPDEKQQIGDLEYTADGSGGVIIAWRLVKDSAPYGDLMAQRVDADGVLRWGEEGMPVFDDATLKYQGVAEVLADGSGGAIIIAAVGTGALTGDMIYAQRLDTDGSRLWGGGIKIDR